MHKQTYSGAILEGFEYLLDNYSEVMIMGQGLWSPWYVGNSMKDLDVRYGKHRIYDTPVSEAACTGAAVGASIAGSRVIVVHPRMDFMLYAMDPIVNQAAKWSYMFNGTSKARCTIRAIVNRGGEQGPQHSQSLHSIFAHVPGLRVVAPSTVSDARDLLISSVLSDDPVMYIDDRWLYEQESMVKPPKPTKLEDIDQQILVSGNDITIAGTGYGTYLARQAASSLSTQSLSAEVVDVRVLNPYRPEILLQSVAKTGRLVVVDCSWPQCSISSEILASLVESLEPGHLREKPVRINLPPIPAPSATALESYFYPDVDSVVQKCLSILV